VQVLQRAVVLGVERLHVSAWRTLGRDDCTLPHRS